MGIDLLGFQTAASDQILNRYVSLVEDPDRPMEKKRWAVPYYQALSALPGAGKTPTLADAVTQIRSMMPYEPIVLWISKGRAVIDQTLANFESGGKYSHFLPDFVVIPLSEVRDDNIRDHKTPLLALATVGSFNQKEKADGSLRVHKAQRDKTRDALWVVLRDRPVGINRRPLIVVYDEGHNLSDQQTELLLELEPDVILVASATMRTPGKLGREIDRLRDYGWDTDQLVTAMKSCDVVEAGLVKKQVIIGGYATHMEQAVDDMLSDMQTVAKKAKAFRAPFEPKAIYVCKTNISQFDGSKDNAARPFKERQAPPILIWRYLVEKKKIPPNDIAVYCELKMDRKYNPPPPDFIHFSGGDEDFAAFTAGNFHHIIFNQSLQEGWDDPACCFAYIDKSMGSAIQIEQVIGRLLRQPGAKHYPDPDLNTANFFIRIDTKQSFHEILENVRKKVAAEIPEVKIEGYSERKERNRIRLDPKKKVTIPEIHIHLDVKPLIAEIDRIIDYTKDKTNVYGKGERIRALQVIGDGSEAKITVEEAQHSNRVMARWIVRRTVQSLYPRAIQSIDWALRKFDARVEVTSPAATELRRAAERLVQTYLDHAELYWEDENPYTVGPVVASPKKKEEFKNSLHAHYSDISPSELPYAKAIDSLGVMWARNPSREGYGIPLLRTGGTFQFFPDFLVWKSGIIYALDPKGGHLLHEAANYKLLDIRDAKNKEKVVVRLFSEGDWKDTETKKSDAGVTLWRLSSGKPRPKHFDTVKEAVKASLNLKI